MAGGQPRSRGQRTAVPPRGRHRFWAWGLSIVALVMIVTVEVVFLRDEISRSIEAVLAAGRPGSPSTAEPVLPPVKLPAPATAGTITQVGLRPVERCVAGAGCALRTQVLLRPRAAPQTLTWTFRVIDRCTGRAVTASSGTVALPAGAGRADVVTIVTLPPARALAVLAVTDLPFPAASEPVYVPARGTCRQ